MKVELENVKPMDIEKRSFEIITQELGDKALIPGTEADRKTVHPIQALILIMRIIFAFRQMR